MIPSLKFTITGKHLLWVVPRRAKISQAYLTVGVLTGYTVILCVIMTYKAELTKAMRHFSSIEEAVVIGYGILENGAAGTLNDFPKDKLIETPVAEGVMLSAAIGLGIAGALPLVFIERFDFILNAMDALVNHLDKIELLSNGQFKPGVIIRVLVGSKKKLPLTGPTHTQDFTHALRLMISIPVISLLDKDDVFIEYCKAIDNAKAGRSSILVEYKDLY